MLDWFGRLKQPTYNKSALGVVLHRCCFRQRPLRVTLFGELPYQRLHPLDWFGGNKQTHYSCQQLELSLRLHLFVYELPAQTHHYSFVVLVMLMSKFYVSKRGPGKRLLQMFFLGICHHLKCYYYAVSNACMNNPLYALCNRVVFYQALQNARRTFASHVDSMFA